MISPVVVPYTLIPLETLHFLLEDFATRAGTDYGEIELDLSTRIQLIERQLKSGDAVLLYLPADDSLQIVTSREARAMGLIDDIG